MNPSLIKIIAYLLSGIWLLTYTAPTYAGLVGTESLLIEANVQQQRNALHAALAREEAQGVLAIYGVSPEQAKERIDKLTDREVRQIASHIDNLPAGGDVAIVLLVIVLVILVLEAVGFIDIFPFM